MLHIDEPTKKFIRYRKEWQKQLFYVQRRVHAGTASQTDTALLSSMIRRISSIIDKRMAKLKRENFINRLSSIGTGNMMHAEIEKMTNYKNRSSIASEIVIGNTRITNNLDRQSLRVDPHGSVQ